MLNIRFAQVQQPVRIVERPKQRAGEGSGYERCVVVRTTGLHVGENLRPELVAVAVDMLRAPVAALQDAVPGVSRLDSPEEARDMGSGRFWR